MVTQGLDQARLLTQKLTVKEGGSWALEGADEGLVPELL